MKKTSHFMPMYWGDYLRDTGHLSAAEHGAYLLLIGHYWTTGKPLPKNDDALRRIARLERDEWDASRDTILGFFSLEGDGYRHSRIDAELEKAVEKADKRSKAGRLGNAVRWQKASQCDGNGIAKTSHPHPHPHPHSTSVEKSLSLIEPLTEDDHPASVAAKPDSNPPDGFPEWWDSVPRKVGKGQAERAYRAALKHSGHAVLLAAIRRFAVECTHKDPQFIPHPATWLNGKRWLDEPALQPATAFPAKGPTNGYASPRESFEQRRDSGRAAIARAVAERMDADGPGPRFATHPH